MSADWDAMCGKGYALDDDYNPEINPADNLMIGDCGK